MKAFCFLFTLLVLQIPHGKSSTSEHVREAVSQPGDPFCSKSSLASAINDFSFKLTEKLGKKDSNLFISPLSISVALAMTHLGARRRTANQMGEVLEYKSHDLEVPEVSEGFKRLLSSLSEVNDEYSLLVANGMLLQQDYRVEKDYVNKLETIYRAVVGYLDFQRNGQAAVNRINNWVARKTNNMIKELFSRPLDPLTRLVLLNAVYFKGTWKTQFPIDNTYDGSFYKTGNTPITVKLMALYHEKFLFLDDPMTGHKFIEFPYKGGNIAMLVALPKGIDSPLDLTMTSELLCRVNSSMATTVLDDIMLPRFKMEYKSDLNGPLKNMGMTDLFQSGTADLTGIRKENDLFVDKIFHKAVIEVNEQGSEAAAVTGVVIVPMSANFNRKSFVANHPFVFYIIDKRNGLVLFSGRVTDPTV